MTAMDELTFRETNWFAIGLGVIGLMGFAASFYVKPRRITFEWVMAKQTMRWEALAFAAFMFALNHNPSEAVVYAGFAGCFIVAIIASWIAYREGKELERQGKLTPNDGKNDRVTLGQRDK